MTPQPSDTVDPRLDRATTALETLSSLWPEILPYLTDPAVTDLTATSTGQLLVKRFGARNTPLKGVEIAEKRREHIIRVLSGYLGKHWTPEAPDISGELPHLGYRFQATLPPMSRGPMFTIRRKCEHIVPLSWYTTSGALSRTHFRAIMRTLHSRGNILIVGATGSGKTVFQQALLQRVARKGRVLVLQDTDELRCHEPRAEFLLTTPERSLRDLVRITLRLTPESIVIGEVRGGEAYDLVTAWLTGHGRGLATIHGDGALLGLRKLYQLVTLGEPLNPLPPAFFARAVSMVVFMRDVPGKGVQVEEVLRVLGYDESQRDYVCENVP